MYRWQADSDHYCSNPFGHAFSAIWEMNFSMKCPGWDIALQGQGGEREAAETK